MSTVKTHASEAEARRVAEGAREKEWGDHTFVRDLFLGDFRLGLIHPYPDPDEHIGPNVAVVTTSTSSAAASNPFLST